MSSGTGVACMICKNDVGTVLCPYCGQRYFLCEQCYPNHVRLVHPDTLKAKDSTNLAMGPFSWKVSYPIPNGHGPVHLPQGTPTLDVRKGKRGKSRKQADHEVAVQYIKNNLRK
jgi:hypothetical protein